MKLFLKVYTIIAARVQLAKWRSGLILKIGINLLETQDWLKTQDIYHTMFERREQFNVQPR
jgi:hypothetical protein